MKLLNEMEVYKAGVDQAYHQQTGFRLGAAFSEQKLLPMMVEFAEWCNKNYHITVHPILPYTWVDLDLEKCFTTEQLLEQFLKTK